MKHLLNLTTAILCVFAVSAAQANELTLEEEWLIKAQIQELSFTYGISRDKNDHDTYANTFAEDGRLVLYGQVASGRDEIRARAAGSNDNIRMHFLTTHKIEVLDSENATGTFYVTVYSAPRPESLEPHERVPTKGPSTMGIYHDTYVLTEDGWKFAERRLEALLTTAD